MKQDRENLEKSIKLAKYRLKQFTDEALTTEAGNMAYNKLLIEKAVAVQALNDKSESKIKKFFGKVSRKVTGKTLICDYF